MRDCSGLAFDHPAASDWFPYRRGDALTFVGANGAADYVVTTIATNVPDTGSITGSNSPDEARCRLERRVLLESSGADHRLEFRLSQSERTLLPAEEEDLTLFFSVLFPNGEEVYASGLLLSPLDAAGEFTESKIEFVETAQLGGTTYVDVLSIGTDESGLARFNAGQIAFESIVLSRGTGVVGLDRSDIGEVYIAAAPGPASEGRHSE